MPPTPYLSACCRIVSVRAQRRVVPCHAMKFLSLCMLTASSLVRVSWSSWAIFIRGSCTSALIARGSVSRRLCLFSAPLTFALVALRIPQISSWLRPSFQRATTLAPSSGDKGSLSDARFSFAFAKPPGGRTRVLEAELEPGGTVGDSSIFSLLDRALPLILISLHWTYRVLSVSRTRTGGRTRGSHPPPKE